MSPPQRPDAARLARALRQHVQGLRAFGAAETPRAPAQPGTGSGKEVQLQQLADDVAQCRACPLYRTRTKPVVSDGSPHAKLMFIGEAPGRDEDQQGVPFVGAAGQLLTKMIQAMGLKREDMYICNVLKDRPPGNRLPEPEEVAACWPFLERQIAIIKPLVICVLGAVAAKTLLGPHVAITKIRGQTMDFHGIPVIPTFHPAYLLRNPAAKPMTWDDLKRVMALLKELA